VDIMKGFLGILPAAGLLAALAGAAGAQPSGARATLFDQPNFQGASVTIVEGSPDLAARGFAGRAMSGRFEGDWTLCDSPGLDGRCASVSGDVADLAAVGLGRRVISLRESEGEDRYASEDRENGARADDGGRADRDSPADANDEHVPGPQTTQAPPPAPVPPPTSQQYAEGSAPAGAGGPSAAAAVARREGEAGRSAVFFAQPKRGGADIEVDAQGPANQFCSAQGLGPALYYDTDGRDLRDVLCRRP
jgi:hypothetical protein